MDYSDAERFARTWVEDWNSHDLDRIMAPYADDVVFTSPLAANLGHGEDGVVRGKAALRAYWADGLRHLPDLHFELTHLHVGLDTLVIGHRDQTGRDISEILTFRDGRIVSGGGAYGPKPA